MQRLKDKISHTIYIPQYLRQWDIDVDTRELVTNLIFDILDHFFRGVVPQFLHGRTIAAVCKKIDHLTYELSQLCDSQIYLQTWLFLGETIESWMQFAVEEEEFEVATNLRKILNMEYA
jgi:hypothetical protein